MSRRALLSTLACAAAIGCADAGPLPASSIRDARVRPSGTSATVEGVATVRSGLLRSFTGENGFFLQDATAGIYVSSEENPEVPRGSLVRVTGIRGSLHRLETIASNPGGIRPLDAGSVPTPRDVATGSVGPANEGSLVRVTGRMTRGITNDLPHGSRLYVDDGSGEVQVFMAASAFDSDRLDFLTPGEVITAVGVSGRYEQVPEVLPRSAADLRPVDRPRSR